MSDPLVGAQVSIQDLAADVQALSAKLDKTLEAIDGVIEKVVERKQRRTWRAIIWSYVWHVVHVVLTVGILLAGWGALEVVDLLESQEVVDSVQDAETAKIRQVVLCPIITDTLASQSRTQTQVPAEQRAEFEHRLENFRKAFVALRCDQPA